MRKILITILIILVVLDVSGFAYLKTRPVRTEETLGAWGVPKIGTLVEDATGDFTLTEPAGAASGDLMVAFIGYRGNAAITGLDSWGVVASAQNEGDTDISNGIASGKMYYITRGASAPDLVGHRTAGDVLQARIIAYSGYGYAYDTGQAGTLAVVAFDTLAGDITTAEANELIVAMVSIGDNDNTVGFDAATKPDVDSGATDTTTAPTADTWLERSDDITTTGADHGLAIADAIKATAANTGNFHATVEDDSRNVMIVGAFKINLAPTTTIDTPDNNATGVSVTPDLLFTGTDANADEVEYEVQVDTADTFASVVGTIDVGSTASDRGAQVGANYTYLDVNNPVASAGTINVVEIWASITIPAGGKIGTFYGSGTSWQVRSFATLGEITAGSKVIVGRLSITAEIGDILGIFTNTSGYVEEDTTGGGGVLGKSGDAFSGGPYTFATMDASGVLSIYGYSGTPLLDTLSSTESPSHFAGTGSPSPFPSGNQITYSVQAAAGLTASTDYYWRVRAKDASGSNTWGAWSLGDASQGYNKFTTAASGPGWTGEGEIIDSPPIIIE